VVKLRAGGVAGFGVGRPAPGARPPLWRGGGCPGARRGTIPASPQPRKGLLAAPENVVSHAPEYPYWEQRWSPLLPRLRYLLSRQLIE
jgi:hypothetical protein